jgi:hypothetical protein
MSYITIVPTDGAVGVGSSEDGRKFVLGLDLSSCGIPEAVSALQWNGLSGHIEYFGDEQNTLIDALPSWANACVAVRDAKISEPAILSLNDIKNSADGLLSITDWSVLPDVNLANQSEWIAYRKQLRLIRANPTTDAVFPEVPAKVWG